MIVATSSETGFRYLSDEQEQAFEKAHNLPEFAASTLSLYRLDEVAETTQVSRELYSKLWTLLSETEKGLYSNFDGHDIRLTPVWFWVRFTEAEKSEILNALEIS